MSIAATHVVVPTLLSSSSALAARWQLKLGSIPAHAAALANKRTAELFRAWRIPSDPIAPPTSAGNAQSAPAREHAPVREVWNDAPGVPQSTRKTVALAPEGASAYFSQAYARAKAAPTSAVSSSVVASTSSLDPLVDWRTYGLVPRTATGAKHLLLAANDAALDITQIEQILDSYRLADQRAVLKDSASLEYQALITLLSERYVGTATQKKTKSISSAVFLMAWNRLWSHQGENLTLAPSFAKYLLRQVMRLKAVASDDVLSAYNASLQLSALRHLLFQADIQRTSILALNLLTQTLLPKVSLHDNSGMYAAIPEMSLGEDTPTTVLPALPTGVYTRDLPLLLHDLLRAGIITPEVIREFDLSAAVAKQSSVAARLARHLERNSASSEQALEHDLKEVKDAENVLRQVLLRIIARTYSSMHGKHAKAAVILRYLQPISAIPTIADERLLNSICASMEALPPGSYGLHPDKVNQLAVTAALALKGKLPFLRDTNAAPSPNQAWPMGLRIANTLDVLIASAPITHSEPYGMTFLMLLQTDVQRPTVLQTPLSLVTIGSALSAVASRPAYAILTCFKQLTTGGTTREDRSLTVSALLSVTVARLRSGNLVCNTDSGNALLKQALAAYRCLRLRNRDKAHMAALSEALCELYMAMRDQDTGQPFRISSDNLAALAPVLAIVHRSGSPVPSPRQVVQEFLQERSGQPDIDPAETSNLIKACFGSGDRIAAMLLLQNELAARRVPAHEDVVTALLDLAHHSPEKAVDVYKAMLFEGYRPTPHLARVMESKTLPLRLAPPPV